MQKRSLVKIEHGRFEVYPVKKNCELSSLIVEYDLKYKIGCIYYEFTRREEDVREDKSVILMEKV